MTRRNVETVKSGNSILGAIVWDHREQIARFSPYTDALKPLARETWRCPIQAREAAIRCWRGREQ